MKSRLICLSIALLGLAAACHFTRPFERPTGRVSSEETHAALESIRGRRALDRLCARAVGLAIVSSPEARLSMSDVGLAVIDLTRPARPRFGACHGFESFDPQQLVALPLAIEGIRQRAEGRITQHQIDELLRRALAEGDPEADNGLMDLLTGAEPGPTLLGPALDDFLNRRQSVNRLLQTLGLYGIVASHHLGEISAGTREEQARQRLPTATNLMTPAGAVRLLCLIDSGQIISGPETRSLVDLMTRPHGGAGPLAARMPEPLLPGATVWGLAAWGSEADHGAWVVALPGEAKVAIAVMTRLGEDRADVARHIAMSVITGFTAD
jgi:hypothetical protein